MGGRGHEIPRALHGSALVQYHPVSERVPVLKESYMIIIYTLSFICFVRSICVNMCELYEHPPHDESSVQGDENWTAQDLSNS